MDHLPLIPYHHSTIATLDGPAPSAPDGDHWLGTDDTARDVLARIIYGFRLSVLFAIIVSVMASAIGIFVGAVQGYLGGRTDLLAQRLIEIWGATPSLYIIIIVSAIWRMDFWLLVFLMTLFQLDACRGGARRIPARAEFRICAGCQGARRVSAGDHVPSCPAECHGGNPDHVAFHRDRSHRLAGRAGFPRVRPASSTPSLGELTLQAKQNLQAPWLGLTAFAVFAMLLALLVFIFGVRDAFDP